MNPLESEYPNVKFVYMTGHLDGGGADGNLNERNEQIRNYVRANNKILFDFADIESYDPDGLVNYMELLANDNCDYDSDGNGVRDTNWATEWQGSHIKGMDWYDCGAQHSQSLNANQKAYAAWWLWARLAGWDGELITVAPVADFTANKISGSVPLTVQFTDTSTGGTPTSWNWDFRDDSTSTSENPLHIFTSAGTYDITMSVSNGAGSDSITQTNLITVVSGKSASRPGVYRSSTGYFYLDYNTDGVRDNMYTFGVPGGTPLVGDWNGDGKTETGLFKNGNWYLDYNNDGTIDKQFRWGVVSGDIPVVGKWV